MAAAGVVAAASALTACGGSSASTAASSAAGSTAGSAAASGSTIKVGVLGPMTGDVSVYGLAVINGATLYLKQVNADGGVNGKQLEIITMDEQGDETQAVTCFTKMVDQGITALVGEIMFRWYYSGNMDGHIAIDNVRLEATGTTGISQATTDHQPLTVYTTQGVKVAETNGATPALPAGVYIFRQNGHTVKKTVK